VTLDRRALDESAHPILGDYWARNVVEQIDVDLKSTGISRMRNPAIFCRLDF
jgi:hypothetical protein